MVPYHVVSEQQDSILLYESEDVRVLNATRSQVQLRYILYLSYLYYHLEMMQRQKQQLMTEMVEYD